MFGYIDEEDEEKVSKTVNDLLAPSLGRPVKDLKELLLFGSADKCLDKVGRSLVELEVQRIHFWPVGDYSQQIEIFRRKIAKIVSDRNIIIRNLIGDNNHISKNIVSRHMHKEEIYLNYSGIIIS